MKSPSFLVASTVLAVAAEPLVAAAAATATEVEAIYLKASNTGGGDRFGRSIAVSGNTLVIGAEREDSGATGVNGDENDESAKDSGAAYVFVRNGGVWTQQAYLKASNAEESDLFGASVAIDGDTIVIGADHEDSAATGVGGDEINNDKALSGAAYVFVRNGSTWTQQAYLKASNTGEQDHFGKSVSISGDTIVVGAYQEDSSATGIDGNESDDSAESAGAAYVFNRNGTSWTQEAYLKASNTGEEDEFGYSVAVSGDTVVVAAHNEDGASFGVNGVQNDLAFRAGAAYVFVRDGSSWSQQAYVKASNTDVMDLFGESVAISNNTIVVGAANEDSDATGVDGHEGSGAGDSGAAYVFSRTGALWSQQAYLKASNTGGSDNFGRSVSVSGDTVIAGAYDEDSAATGVDGDGSDDTAGKSGAAYVFVRNGSTWSHEAYLKASNTGGGDEFGWAVAVSESMAVIGAQDEDGSATGVGGDGSLNDGMTSGAAYAFDLDTTDPWTDLGGGTTGIAGPPRLTMSGPLTPGSTITLDLVDGPPSSLGIVFLSLSSTPIPLFGGVLHTVPVSANAILPTTPLGTIHATVNFSGAPAGVSLWFQVVLVDASVALYGATLSNGVRGTVR